MFYINVDKIQLYMDWFKEKFLLDANANNASKRKVNRGQVYKCRFGRNIGSEQDKTRPCVILQNQNFNKTSSNTIVAPITHTKSNLDIVVPIKSLYDNNDNLILDGNVL